MKFNKKLVISAMLLLVLFLCINASSAEEQLNETLTTDNVDFDETINSVEDNVDLESKNDDEIALSDSTGYLSGPEDGKNTANVYVQPGASDNSSGTRDNPVGTIAKALELSEGQIVLLPGTHKTGDLGTISNDLVIAGEGNAIIDAGNNNRILHVGEDAHVVIKNVIMVNGYSIDGSGALLGNANELTLINCTLANSSAGENNGGAIFNVGKLILINTTISNCNAKMGGAVFTQTSSEHVSVELINSTFENNVASGHNAFGGGAVYVQRTRGFYNFELTIDGCEFINNKAQGGSCGGAIALAQLDATVKITNSKFVSNHANGQSTVGGGAIYTTGADNYQRYGTMTIDGTLFENNTCGADGGAIYAKTTTVKVSNSVLMNNSDANGLAVYGFKTDTSSPSITLNDNWWGSNDSPKGLVGGNNRYSPTISRWAILTVSNETPIVAGSTVKLTVSINNYTTGSSTGALSKPITVPCDFTVETSFGDINGTLKNGEFSFDYLVPENLKYIIVSVDSETQVLYVVPSRVSIQIDEISGRKFDKIDVVINVTSDVEVNAGNIELYVGNDRIAVFEVKNSRAAGELIISRDVGTYDLTAKYVGGSPLFDDGEANTTLTVKGEIELYNDTFFNFFDDEGFLRDEFVGNELVFHGDFSNLGISTITILKSLDIIGDNAKLYDISMTLVSDDIKVSNMTFVSSNGGAVISLQNENIEINNVFINVTAPNTIDSYAILADSAKGFILSNSTVVFHSNNAGAIHHAIHISNSDNIEISGNTINASLPAMDVDWHYSEPFFDSINQDMVLAIGIQYCNEGILTENKVNVITTAAKGNAPTIDAIIVYGVTDFEISWNNITQIDTVNAGQASYSNALDLYAFERVTVKYNNILVNTTSGIAAKGTAYPIQATGPYASLLIDHNNLTSISNGPALAIYSQNYNGITDIEITFNRIDVTGLATENDYALVSGMELQDTNAKVYNNTIQSRSKGSYGDLNSLYGISYAQSTEGTHSYDIENNTIVTEGRYAVYLKSAKNSRVSNNLLYAHELRGDDAVNISKSDACIVENNRPDVAQLAVSVENITVGDEATVNITSNAKGIITLLLNNEFYGNFTFNGNKMINIPDLVAGDYNVTVIFKSTDINYMDGECTVKFIVSKLNPNLVVEVDSTVRAGETIVINVTYATTSDLIATIDGENVSVIDGKIIYYVTKSGLHTINVFASENDMYNQANETKVFNASKKDAIIILNPFDNIKIGDTIVITPETNSDGALTIRVNDEFVGREYTVSSNGTYTVLVESAETEIYNAGSISVSFMVFKDASSVNITIVPARAGEKSVIYVDVSDGAGGIVVINVNGTDYPINVSDEKLELELSSGSYPVFATYCGDAKFSESVSEVKNLTVLDKLDANIKIDIPSDIKICDSIVIGAQSDSDGAITIKINGIETDGTYVIPSEGTYNITVESAETRMYKKGFNSTSFKVFRESSTVNVTVLPGRALEESQMVVKVTEGAIGKIIVKLNGTEVYKGFANETDVVSLGNLSAGSYVLNVTYEGDVYYNNSQNITEFSIFKSQSWVFADSLEIVQGNAATLTVHVNEGAGGKVSAVIGNNTYWGDILNGTANVNIADLDADKYDVAVLYWGDERFDSSSNNTVITVKKQVSSDVFNIDVNVLKGANSPKFTIKLPSDATGKLTVIVDGEISYTESLVGGSAVVSVDELSFGKHNVQVVYSGDEKYSGISKNVSVDIKSPSKVKLKTKFIAKKKTFKAKTKTKKYSVTLKAGKNPVKKVRVTLKIKGKLYKAKTNAKGKATFKIKKLSRKGKYWAIIKFAGNNDFKKTTKKVRITVKK